MAMDLGGAKGGVKSDINVTPLVDVMLVLLIIMMIVAPMLQKGVDVKLPTASERVGQAGDAGADGRRDHRGPSMFLNARPGPAKTTCARRSPRSSKTKKEKIVLIKADEDAQYGRVMATMDQLREARHRGHGPHHRAQGPGRRLGRRTEEQRQWLTHTAPRRGRGRQGGDAASQRGHERHADDRRAARAARHLHGGPAAQRRRASTSTCPPRPNRPTSSSRTRRARSCSSTRPTSRSRSTSRTSRSASSRHGCGTSSSSARTRRCSSPARRHAALRRHRRGHRRGQGRRRREGRHRHRGHAPGRGRSGHRWELEEGFGLRARALGLKA